MTMWEMPLPVVPGFGRGGFCRDRQPDWNYPKIRPNSQSPTIVAASQTTTAANSRR